MLPYPSSQGVCDDEIHSNVTLVPPYHPQMPPTDVTCVWKLGHPKQVIVVKLVADVVINVTPSPSTCGLSPLKVLPLETMDLKLSIITYTSYICKHYHLFFPNTLQLYN